MGSIVLLFICTGHATGWRCRKDIEFSLGDMTSDIENRQKHIVTVSDLWAGDIGRYDLDMKIPVYDMRMI